VSEMAQVSSAWISFHIVDFSVWSGCDGYPGAGRIPWYFTRRRSGTSSTSSCHECAEP
jgi:hypothetical protein